MFKGISWSSFFLFMLVAVVVYYVVVAFLYFRPEIMALIQGKGKIQPGSVPQAPKQPVLVATGSAFTEPEPAQQSVPVPEPHLPAAAAAAAAALAAGAETSDAQEAKEPTMDDGTGKVLSSDDAAVADEYENPTENSEEAELAEAKRLLELGKENSSNPNSSAVVEGSANEELNQNEGNTVDDTHNITKFTEDHSEESDSHTLTSMMEPVDLNDDAQPLEMIQVDDELEVSDTLIGAGDLSNLLDGLSTGEIGAEDLAAVAPVFNGTELSTRFAANKKRRNQEVESMFADDE